MVTLLVILSLVFGAGGLIFASQATGGVAAICVGCLFAILARIAQASIHHAQDVAARKPPEA